MRRENALWILDIIRSRCASEAERDAVDLGIKALNKEQEVDDAVSSLLTVREKRENEGKKVGQWKIHDERFPWAEDFDCQKCGKTFRIGNPPEEIFRFCPYCGDPKTDEVIR